MIIWDFDGVIADSELVWVENRRVLLNEQHNLSWDLTTAFNHLGGMSDATKDIILRQMGIVVGDAFWEQALKMDYASVKAGKMPLTPNIVDILKEYKGRQCVATGGVFDKTKRKISALNIGEFFDDTNTFTADMVKYGKPEPDVFLLAQQSMGWAKEDCVIVEDSIPGIVAGIKSGIKTVAFVGNIGCGREEHVKKIIELGVDDVFYNMVELKNFLNSL